MLFHRVLLIVALWIASLGLVSCTQGQKARSSSGSERFALVYSSNLDGEIDPCG